MKITITSKLVFEGSNNESILESAKKCNITFSHSCLNGRCSECKVKVVSGQYNMPKNQEGLSDQEIADGYCLSCITNPQTDLILSEVNYFEGILPQIKIIPAKIHKLEFLSEEVVKVIVRTPPNNPLKFHAGQYVNLSVNNIKRSYSIASKPSEQHLEFIIKKYPNGIFSNYLFYEAKLNDLLRIEGPKGTYIFPSKLERNLVFISTGTGIAPNFSLIKYGLEKKLFKPTQVIVIHGQRTVSEHVYSFDDCFDGIKIIRATSRENKSGFFNGYVQDALLKEDLDLTLTQVFACGNIEMVSCAKSLLVKNGLKPSNFKSDIFIKSN